MTTNSYTADTDVPESGDTKGSSTMRKSTTTSVKADGSTTVTTEEVMPDGSKNIRSVTYPPGAAPPIDGASGEFHFRYDNVTYDNVTLF